jgi:hypothetical protein
MKKEALDSTLLRIRFGRSYEPVVRENINEWNVFSQAMKAYGGSRGIATPFLNLGAT